MVVAFTPGGPTDAMARLLADKLGDQLGQRVIVENRPGAGGNIGYESVARSPADGYTLAFVDPSLTVNPSLYTPAKYDAERDFTPISLAVRGPTVMTVPSVGSIAPGKYIGVNPTVGVSEGSVAGAGCVLPMGAAFGFNASCALLS